MSFILCSFYDLCIFEQSRPFLLNGRRGRHERQALPADAAAPSFVFRSLLEIRRRRQRGWYTKRTVGTFYSYQLTHRIFPLLAQLARRSRLCRRRRVARRQYVARAAVHTGGSRTVGITSSMLDRRRRRRRLTGTRAHSDTKPTAPPPLL